MHGMSRCSPTSARLVFTGRAMFTGRVTVAIIATVLSCGCGNSEFDAIKDYKTFLEDAKPSLQAMNRVREELMQVSTPEETLLKFRDELLPEVKKLAALAESHPAPDSKKLKAIHETLQSVMSNYAASTTALVDSLGEAKEDKDREAALVRWGGDDEKFGRNMTALVQDLETYLEKLRKG